MAASSSIYRPRRRSFVTLARSSTARAPRSRERLAAARAVLARERTLARADGGGDGRRAPVIRRVGEAEQPPGAPVDRARGAARGASVPAAAQGADGDREHVGDAQGRRCVCTAGYRKPGGEGAAY